MANNGSFNALMLSACIFFTCVVCRDILLHEAAGKNVDQRQTSYSILETVESTTDLITSLPGQPEVEFKQYSGYVTVNATSGKNFFYWLTEAEDPDDKPLVLWLNGGPGCSSVGGGLLMENGPWRVADSTSENLNLNPFAWNQYANLLFLESPAGVGFSYTETKSDLVTGDDQTALDNYIFLQGFLSRHARYQNRSFYITGESYAGHYIPQLTKLILEKNGQSNNTFIPLKGFAVGNALTEISDDILYGTLKSFNDHALISDFTWDTIYANCIFEWDYTSDYGMPSNNATCNAALQDAYTQIGNVDPYDIFADSCTYEGGNFSSFRKTNLHKFLPGLSIIEKIREKKQKDRISFHNSQIKISLETALKTLRTEPYSIKNSACQSLWVQKYLNRADVKKAIHAKPDLPYQWTDCSDTLQYDYQFSFAQSIVPIYAKLMKTHPELRIWVYSGDTDTVVPFVGTRLWLKTLPLNVTKPYYAWYDSDQVGGYSEVYNGLTFVTVRGAGHLVPLGQPSRALALFSSFLNGTALPGPPQELLA